MDWDYAIERHRQPLLTIVAALYAMIGLAEGGSIEKLRRPLYRAVLALLRPAESAVRRLIIVAARGLVGESKASRSASAKPGGRSKGKSRTKAKRQRRREFQLVDPVLRPDAGMSRPIPRAEPRIHFFHVDPRVPEFLRPAPPQPAPKPAPEPDDSVSAKSLCRRLAAIKEALEDLQRQAKRYARWRDKPIAERRPPRETALRRGSPPGLRKTSKHEVHEILQDCQWLARTVLQPDTG